MSLDDTLRWAEHFPMDRYPEDHHTPEPDRRPNWRWMQLWEQENPNPGSGLNFKEWNEARWLMSARVWCAAVFPELRVMDWGDEDLIALRRLVARHVCGVCGRADDPGCSRGC